MILSAVVAVADNGVIGREGALPWHLPADLAHFKAKTMGKPVLMGRRTYDSIGRPLPGRRNLVLTRRAIGIDGVEIVHTLDEALACVAGTPELAVIGGEQLFRELLPRFDVIHLTEVHADVPGDTVMPALDRSVWRETERIERAPDERNPYPMSFVTLERLSEVNRSTTSEAARA
ncbi:dihydrofolate reductase [bacterium]|nr:MAG: dihydrofolate reductase [bacterium]